MRVLGEIAYEGTNLMPELSFGTHFFQDLVETDIFYLAIFPQLNEFTFNEQWFEQMHNELELLAPGSEKYKDAVKVCDVTSRRIRIVSDILSQKLICFREI